MGGGRVGGSAVKADEDRPRLARTEICGYQIANIIGRLRSVNSIHARARQFGSESLKNFTAIYRFYLVGLSILGIKLNGFLASICYILP